MPMFLIRHVHVFSHAPQILPTKNKLYCPDIGVACTYQILLKLVIAPELFLIYIHVSNCKKKEKKKKKNKKGRVPVYSEGLGNCSSPPFFFSHFLTFTVSNPHGVSLSIEMSVSFGARSVQTRRARTTTRMRRKSQVRQSVQSARLSMTSDSAGHFLLTSAVTKTADRSTYWKSILCQRVVCFT